MLNKFATAIMPQPELLTSSQCIIESLKSMSVSLALPVTANGNLKIYANGLRVFFKLMRGAHKLVHRQCLTIGAVNIPKWDFKHFSRGQVPSVCFHDDVLIRSE